jgi:hypothetical protein
MADHKITVVREITVPDGFFCENAKRRCGALTKEVNQSEDTLVCSNFNRYVHFSRLGGSFLKCKDCIEATLNYYRRVDT